jgi:hypothetical protein
MKSLQLKDVVVAIERTGDYHRPVQRVFREAGFDTRIVHPYTAKQYRQPANPDDKTDDHDLAAIFRAASHGFGLCEAAWPADYTTLQILRRHRRDLVDKNSILMCQVLEKLPAAMPGYASCFTCIWDSPVALAVARRTTSAAAIRQLGLAGLQQLVNQQGLRCRRQTLANILAWAFQAPPGHSHSLDLRLVLGALEDERVWSQPRSIVANVGNFHCLAFHLSGGAIAGCFEHHTGELQPAQLEAFLLKLADGTLTNREIFESMGHGALVLRPTPGAQPFLAVTGPRRAMLRSRARGADRAGRPGSLAQWRESEIARVSRRRDCGGRAGAGG